MPNRRPALKHTNPQASVKIGQRVNIINKTAPYSCLAGESGSHYTNVGDVNDMIWTLPALLKGWEGWFHACTTGTDMAVSAPSGDTMVVFNNIAADQVAYDQAGEIAGGTFHVTCDGTLWYVSELGHDAQEAVIADA